MAKTIYITESQLELIEQYIEEEIATGQQNKAEIPLQAPKGTTIQQAVLNKNKELSSAGVPINKVQYTISPNAATNGATSGMLNAGKTYKKAQIEEMRVGRLVKEGKCYTKKEFANIVLKDNE